MLLLFFFLFFFFLGGGFKLFLLLLQLLLLLDDNNTFPIQIVYRQDKVIHKFIRRFTILPFLSAKLLQSMFVRIESLVPPNGKMCDLINYVCQPWIEHPVFDARCWTVYHITVPVSHNRSGSFWLGFVFFATSS